MKILFLCPHTKVSGGTKVIFRMAEYLTKIGESVTVITQKLHSRNPPWIGLENLPFALREINNPSKYNLPKVDVIIHYGDGTAFGPLPNCPQVLFLQGFGTQDYAREAVNLLYKYNGVITTSNWLANLARRAGHKKVGVVHPGVDPIFTPTRMPRNYFHNIGCLYHDSPAKNITLFMAAANKLMQQQSKMKFLYLSARLPKNSEQFNKLLHAYSLLVDPPQEMLPYVYGSCKMWISPSTNEGFGLPILEAMACGVPVIAVPSYGLDEYLVHDANCLLVADGSKHTLIECMTLLYDQKGLRSKLVEGGLQLAAQFTWEKAAKQFVSTLKTLLSK